jgi:predicted  nucleic acid-binding Zn-ribbon protein
MTFPRGKQIKLSKYCYRMNNACGQRNFRKAGDYFNHLKFHAMTGGAGGGEISRANEDLLIKIGKDLAFVVGELRKLQAELAQVNQELEDTRSSLGDTKRAQSKAVAVGDTEKVQELDAKIAQLELKITQLETEKAALTDQIKSLTDENAQLKTEMGVLQGRFDALDAKTQLMNREYAAANAIGAQYLVAADSTTLNNIPVNPNDYQNATEALDYLKQIKAAVEEKLKAIEESGVKTAEAQAATVQLDKMRADTEKEIADLNKQLLASQGRIVEVEGELDDEKKVNTKLLEDNTKLETSTNTKDNDSFNAELTKINYKLQEVIDNYKAAPVKASSSQAAASPIVSSIPSPSTSPKGALTSTSTTGTDPTAAAQEKSNVNPPPIGAKEAVQGMGPTPKQVVTEPTQTIGKGSKVLVKDNTKIGKNTNYPKGFNIRESTDKVEGTVSNDPDISGNVTVQTGQNKSITTNISNLVLVQ